MIINREKEIEKLKRRYESDKSEFVAIYGRRRVGKTYLIDQTFGDSITFRHSGLSPIQDDEFSNKDSIKQQLKHFHRSLVLQGMKDISIPNNWLEAFYLLEDFLVKKSNGEKMVVFLDEIQWMDTKQSNFITGLEAFWNGWTCHRNDILLVVCGSSTSWVLDKLIKAHGGLYGRLTEWFKLEPFNLSECEKYLKYSNIEMTRYDILQTYMALGGIPYYLDMLDYKLSFAENIDSLFFSRNAKLRDEFDSMFASIFTNSDVIKKIIKVISTKKRGLTRQEIIDKLGLSSGGTLSSILSSLINGDFIIKYKSFSENAREEYYKLIDPFCLFYLRFIDRKNTTNTNYWKTSLDSQEVIVWEGNAFENVCFNHIEQIKNAIGISSVISEESLWSKKGTLDQDGTQVDLIIKRKDNVINMCEIKFYSDEFVINKEYHELLIRRKNLILENVKRKNTVHNILVTTYGLKRNMYSGDFIKVITLDHLFSPLSI